jgi:hypothetical protein
LVLFLVTGNHAFANDIYQHLKNDFANAATPTVDALNTAAIGTCYSEDNHVIGWGHNFQLQAVIGSTVNKKPLKTFKLFLSQSWITIDNPVTTEGQKSFYDFVEKVWDKTDEPEIVGGALAFKGHVSANSAYLVAAKVGPEGYTVRVDDVEGGIGYCRLSSNTR